MPSSTGAVVSLPSDRQILIAREFDAPKDLVYEGAPGSPPAIVTTTFTEVDGRTHLELLTDVESREIRDIIMESGMEVGVQEQMELLEELARSLR